MSHDKVLPIRSLNFLDQEGILEAGDEIIIPENVMHEWMELFPAGTSMLAKMTNMDAGTERVVCIGSADKSNYIFAPQWILEQLCCGGEEPLVYIAPYLNEVPPAQRISIKPMDNAGYHTDLRDAFERYLDRFHVMEAGTTLCVPLEELGGYELYAYVEQVVPAGIVRLGGEVQIEFLEPEGGIPEHEPPVNVIATEPIAANSASASAADAVAEAAVTTTTAAATTSEDMRQRMRDAWKKRAEEMTVNGLNKTT